jgi:hypothetical protein
MPDGPVARVATGVGGLGILGAGIGAGVEVFVRSERYRVESIDAVRREAGR